MALKDELLSAGKKALAKSAKEVHVEELGITVWLRKMSGTERDAWEDETYTSKGKEFVYNRKNLRARLLVRCLLDGNGDRIFTDAEAATLGNSLPSSAIGYLSDIATELNAISKKEEEQLLKNSPAGQSAGNGSASPDTSACLSAGASAK